MEEWRSISQEQVVMAFVATCIETTARHLGVDYKAMYQRMEHVGLIEHYIVPNYEPLHSESREVLAERLVECLTNWEQHSFDSRKQKTVVQEIVLSNRIGAIAVLLAQQLQITAIQALQLFYESKTCENLHDHLTGLYLYGDLYVAEEFMREMEDKQ